MPSSHEMRRQTLRMPSNTVKADREELADARPQSRAPSPSPGPSRAPSQVGDDRAPPQPKPKVKKRPPQKGINEFWAKFTTKTPGKAYTILPDNLYAKRAAAHAPKGVVPGENATASYEEAVAACQLKVEKIKKECRRVNQKYRDPHFDIEADFARTHDSRIPSDCLSGLIDIRNDLRPLSVKRVEDIFDEPQFFIDGATANDVRQGKDGDCWFMSALSTLSNKDGLIQKVCVARDEEVGVYGFVFHRDGEWISEVIDDKLYLIKEDFDDSTVARNQWLELQNRTSPEEEYRAVMQKGSRALYFAQCSDQNETWLPLLEKAYAKAHGDYGAIDGGFVGEGIEDLTGGVTTELFATDILDKDRFWHTELMRVNKDFLFGCGQMGGVYGQRRGIQEKHAYSIMEAVEIDGVRLLKLRNPWGNTEWRGPWSDGSSEWTPEWMQKLNHKFGDDGIFWISYRDLLRNYQHFDRTRLFGPEWSVTQRWTSLNVPWSVDYLDTKFKITLRKAGPVVIVLQQLDDRYFLGLEGQYTFRLQFRIHAEGEDDYIVRSNGSYYMKRSVSSELTLEPGTYIVLLRIIATRNMSYPTPEEVLRHTCRGRREKLLQIGLSYDLAHAKGGFRTLEKEKKKHEKRSRYEKQKAELKKAHEARSKSHRKQKLRKMRLDMKKFEKAARRVAEEQAQAEHSERFNGLGIDVNDMSAQGAERRNDAIFGSPQPMPFQPSGGPTNTDSRPTTPNAGGVRRDTLPIHPSGRRSTLSPVPNIYVHRPSIDSNRLSLSDVSDDDLSWDSELMGPESELESDSDETVNHGPSMFDGFGGGHGGPGYMGGPGFMGGPPTDLDEDSEDDFERDPWNAVVTVGLRVYSQDKEVSIDILGPGDDLRPDGIRTERTLDLDDSAKDITKRHDGTGSPLDERRPELPIIQPISAVLTKEPEADADEKKPEGEEKAEAQQKTEVEQKNEAEEKAEEQEDDETSAEDENENVEGVPASIEVDRQG